jgi:hypothetical protein
VTGFAALLRHADAIGRVGTVSAAAVLRPPRSAALAQLPVLPWLRSLVLDANRLGPVRAMLHSDGVAWLAEAPLLGTLRELRIDGHWAGGRGLRALASSPHLRGLTALSLNDTHSDDGWQDLLASPNTRNLRRLSMRGPHDGVSVYPGFRAKKAEMVAAAANLAGLESLDVSNNSVDPTSYRTLLASPHLAGLRELIARTQGLNPETLAPFADRQARPRLKVLDVSRSGFRGDGLRCLLDAPCLAELEQLSLSECRLTGPDAELFAGADWRTTLTALDLSENRLQGAGLRRLFSADWPRLRLLRLAQTGLKPPALKALTAWPGLKRLGVLDLTGHEMGPDAGERLTAAGLPAEAL